MLKCLTLIVLSSVLAADHFLTFIIPCYNCSPWLTQAIDSIYQQHLLCPFEVICTDDGSTDNTYEVLLRLKESHPEIQVYQHCSNQGGSAARNTCVQKSRGDIIFNLDADNVLYPDSVNKLIQVMDEKGADVASFGGAQYFKDNFELLSIADYNYLPQFHTLKEVLECGRADCAIWSGNYLYTRESFDRAGGYPVGCVIDTFAFGFYQLLKGCKFCYVPHLYYLHRMDVDGYFAREARSGRLQLHFLELMLDNRNIFTTQAVDLLLEEWRKAKDHNSERDFIWLISEKHLQLK